MRGQHRILLGVLSLKGREGLYQYGVCESESLHPELSVVKGRSTTITRTELVETRYMGDSGTGGVSWRKHVVEQGNERSPCA